MRRGLGLEVGVGARRCKSGNLSSSGAMCPQLVVVLVRVRSILSAEVSLSAVWIMDFLLSLSLLLNCLCARLAASLRIFAVWKLLRVRTVVLALCQRFLKISWYAGVLVVHEGSL